MNEVSRAVLAQRIAERVVRTPGVARLSPGAGVEVATQYARGKVTGVAVSEEKVSVHIVANQLPLAPVIERAQATIQAVLHEVNEERSVEVVVEDLERASLPLHGSDITSGASSSSYGRKPRTDEGF